MQQKKTVILPILAAAALSVATPVLAADYIVSPRSQSYNMAPPSGVGAPIARVYTGPLTLQDALAIASGIGVVTVQNTHYDDNEWEIEGRDSYGKWIQVDIDARTGEVRNVDRSII
jgi:hypothetical protein